MHGWGILVLIDVFSLRIDIKVDKAPKTILKIIFELEFSYLKT